MIKKIKKRYLLTGITMIFFGLWSCEDILEVPDISDKSVALIAPTENAVVEANTTTFTWQNLEDAEKYRLQVATPNFSSAAQVLADTVMTKLNFTQELLPGTYEWRVKALNSGFETPYSTYKFTVIKGDGFAGNKVILLAPTENFASNGLTQTLEWQELEGAVDYRLQVLEGETIVLDETLETTSLEVTFEEGTYTWRVRAQNSTESTLYTSRVIIIDLTNPQTPQLTAPTNNASLSDPEVDFTWTRVDVPGSEEIDSVFVYSDTELTNLIFKGRGTGKALSTTLDPDTYYWNVKAFDKAGNESTSSEKFSFIVN